MCLLTTSLLDLPLTETVRKNLEKAQKKREEKRKKKRRSEMLSEKKRSDSKRRNEGRTRTRNLVPVVAIGTIKDLLVKTARRESRRNESKPGSQDSQP